VTHRCPLDSCSYLDKQADCSCRLSNPHYKDRSHSLDTGHYQNSSQDIASTCTGHKDTYCTYSLPSKNCQSPKDLYYHLLQETQHVSLPIIINAAGTETNSAGTGNKISLNRSVHLFVDRSNSRNCYYLTSQILLKQVTNKLLPE